MGGHGPSRSTGMKVREYGEPSGKPVVYFHGAPGSPHEACMLDAPARQHGLRVLCFDRFAIEQRLQGEAYYRHLAQAINAASSSAPVDFIGFSLGTHVALQTSRYLPGQVSSLHLVSAVAPLDRGDFLPAMAGKAVFNLARNQPSLFRLLSRFQAVLARRSPGLLYRMLFACAQGADAKLAQQPEFKATMQRVLAECFAEGIGGYARDIEQFLAPWPAGIFDEPASVHLWHGSADNWSPPGMSRYLARVMTDKVQVHWMEGLSHYSCLQQAAPEICRLLS
ncbi:alpha/beta fold hydrolase [Pseudomonas sp. NCHU5208]|uniref:alpha/beta fold hydrolase n=1 Tax=unclassified Pseudomonas TaxID=196821 RepID=UPI003F979DC6